MNTNKSQLMLYLKNKLPTIQY